MVEIRNLEELLVPYIGEKKKVISSDVSHFTAPGENYISVVLKVDAVIEDGETGKLETLHGVGKCIHTSNINEILVFLGKESYKREQFWYTEIIPMLQNFAKEKGLSRNFDLFPRVIAYRANLTGEKDVVDEDSILLIENLAPLGFKNIERQIGLDYEGAKRILEDIAVFHAIPIAFKLQKKEVFEEKLRKHLGKIKFPYSKQSNENKEGTQKPKPLDIWLEALASRENCKPYLSKLQKIFEKVYEDHQKFFDEYVQNEPFVSICHGDLWINNTLQILNGDKILDNKLIDFQLYSYDSPGHDVLFFIWTSVQLQVIKEHFDDLLQYYHLNLLQVLHELGCDLIPFSYEQFEKELKLSAEKQIMHTLQISEIVFGKKGEFAINISANAEKREKTADDISDTIRDRMSIIIQLCGERGWI